MDKYSVGQLVYYQNEVFVISKVHEGYDCYSIMIMENRKTFFKIEAKDLRALQVQA